MSPSANKPYFKNDSITLQVGGKLNSFTVESENSFSLLFFLSPNILLDANDLENQILLPKNSYILHYASSNKEASLISKNNSHIDFLHIQIRHSYILNLLKPEENFENNKVMEKMMKNQFLLLHENHPPKITVEMHMIIKEITGSSKKGVLQKLLIEAKIIKLLMLIFEQFSEEEHISPKENTAQLIKNFVDRNYSQQISAHEIALKFGFNETKIRSEFKSEFKITIAEYINELRMLKAKKMIINQKHLIKEIALECGYEYVPNFSRAFKKKFGISPDKLRNS